MNLKKEQTDRFSHIGNHSNSNNTYSMQYYKAFTMLYNSSEPVDTIALPMMFLLRHYIELSLKHNIIYFSKFSESKFMLSKIKSEHKLKSLAEAFKQHWRIVTKKHKLEDNGKRYIDDFDSFIDLMDNLDNLSMAFRYPLNKEGNEHFEWDKTLNIYDIKKKLDKAEIFLDVAIDVFHHEVGQYLKNE